MKKNYTVVEAAKILKICTQRVNQKIMQGHFPHAYWCECGKSRLIPAGDLKLIPIDRRRKK